MRVLLFVDKNHVNFHPVEFFTVYSDAVLESIQEIPGVELVSQPVYSQELSQKKDITRTADILLSNWGMALLSDAQVEEYFPNVRAVFYAGGTTHHFDHPFRARGVQIFAASQANAEPAAEYTLANILLANKYFQMAVRSYAQGAWSYDQARARVAGKAGNYRAKVGLIGVGRVGSRVAELLRPFDVTVLACDPYLAPQRARQLDVEIVEIEELFSTCDVVCSHLPDNDQTLGLLNYELFSLMPSGATFINAAQYPQVEDGGLIRALTEDPTRVAILDSIEERQAKAGTHPLLKMPNVFVSPHIAGSFGGELERMGVFVAGALQEYMKSRSTT